MTNGLPEPSSAAPIVSMVGERVGAYRVLEPREVVDEREVDDPVAAGSSGAQDVQIVQVAAEYLGSRGGDSGGGGVRPGEPEDLMTRADQFRDNG